MSLGIIGGMGPMAGALFQEMIIELTDAKRDQDHLETILFNCPGIPDRTDYILGRSAEDPFDQILKIAKKLEELGVSAIAIPCVSSAFMRNRLQAELKVPVLYGISKTARDIKGRRLTRAGIMATEGSLKTGVIQTALEEYGIEPGVPSKEDTKKIMDLIYRDVKSGRDADISLFDEVRDNLIAKGAQTIILGCTELSVIYRKQHLEGDITDIMRSLVTESIKTCGKRVKRSDIRYAAAKCS